jgi:aminoglycoside/choline kinase family phosphotransferase
MIPPEAAPAFLARNGWAGAAIRPLAGDASFRRYFRVEDRGRTAVLMDAPPEHEDCRPFLFVGNWLLAQGLSAPRVLAGDLDLGLLLLEDFGDRRMGPVLLEEPGLEEAVYARSIDLLAHLNRVPPPLELRPYGRDELLREVLLFPDWYLKAAGVPVDEAGYVAAWDAVWGEVLDATARAPVLTLRDYHADNLMLLAGRDGVQGLGLLDFQDALLGHPAYDLASLLQDARRDVPTGLEAAMLGRFVRSGVVGDEEAFRRAYAVLATQRNVKILGIFVRLRDRDGRAGYVERLPRVWAHVERTLEEPALAPVRAWFDAHVPPAIRAPWCA